MSRRASLRVGCFSISLAAKPAQAHLIVTGMGPIYDGVTHLVLSPEDCLPLVALAFVAGLRGPTQARHLCFVLPSAWFAGGAFALWNIVPPPIVISYQTAALLILIGGMLAANRKLSSIIFAILGATLGIVRGMADFAQLNTGDAHILVLIGVCASVFALSALAASVSLPLERTWIIMTLRVLGSWTAALGLLLLGWLYRYGAVAI